MRLSIKTEVLRSRVHLSNIGLAFDNINFIFAPKINSSEIAADEIFLMKIQAVVIPKDL